jgi:hypothetical protein
MKRTTNLGAIRWASVIVAAALAGCGGVPPGESEDIAASRAALEAGAWTATGAMATPRATHTATLLPDGSVLVAGSGAGAPSSSTVEIYDPVAGTWRTAAPLLQGRAWHSATLVTTPAGPRVLVAGGQGGVANDVLATAELYDPATDTWTSAAPMSGARSTHTATRLTDGRVLVAGGGPNEGAIYDPTTDTWQKTASMNVPPHLHVAALLPSGHVLVAGTDMPSFLAASAEEYDPTTNVWTPVGPLAEGRNSATATRLQDGTILVAGGFFEMPPFTRQSAEIYDPAAHAFTKIVPMVLPRGEHATALLPDGSVLLAGGQQVNHGMLADAERYDPATHAFAATAPLSVPRAMHTLTVLGDGSALAAGGSDGKGFLTGAEIYRLSPGSPAVSGAGSSASSSSSGRPAADPLPWMDNSNCAYAGPAGGAGGLGAALLLLGVGASVRRQRRSGR